jgi:alkanesulfonate monooxygenase SsuD/methylene tetrahydromethanopterin reductase-like flavin-dependent oxidoreductase (luciferase family)
MYAFTGKEYMPAMYRTLDIVTQGFQGIYIGDHLNGDEGYTIEAWTMLTWIAARYPGVKVGSHVMCNPFRNPALTAKMAASLQDISAGRFILGYGVGTGRVEEYDGYGYPFPTPRVRVEMMEEALQVIKTLWTDMPANFSGKYYSLSNAHCEPRPNPAPPILVGGAGEKRTLRVVAKHADWWNAGSSLWRQAPRKLAVLKGYCEEEGTDYDAIRKTYAAFVFIDKTHSKGVEASKGWEDRAIAGDPSAIRDQIEEMVDLGFDLANLAFMSFPETDDIELFMDEVVPHFS